MNTWNVRYRQYSNELRFNGSFLEKFRYTVGAYFFQYSADQNARVSLDGALNGTPVQTTFDFLEFDPVHNDSKSGFVHLEYNPIDALTFTVGGRYTKDFKSFQYGRALAPGYPGTFLDGSVVPVNGLVGIFKGHRNDYSFTAGLQVDTVHQHLLERGQRFQGRRCRTAALLCYPDATVQPGGCDGVRSGFEVRLVRSHSARQPVAL